MKVRKNDKGLPFLDQEVINAVFDCVYGLEGELTFSTQELLKNRYFNDFIQVLKVNQNFIYFHRQSSCHHLFPIFEETVGPFERNSDGTTFWLALGLSIKELYGMRSATLKELLKQVKVRK